MIPKIIHYCWFGNSKIPEDHSAYIDGWKKLLPEYEIKLWNESNFDINSVPFTRQVAETKKWGFIVDYIRAYVVYHYGGIYLDTDVELLRPFDEEMLQHKCFGGFENEAYIAPGLIFAGEKQCQIAKELMNFYASCNFINENGELNLTPSPKIFTSLLKKHGLEQNNVYQELDVFTAYPVEYFCPVSFKTGIIKMTENTYSIHHFAGTWVSQNQQKFIFIRRKCIAIFGVTIGSLVSYPYFIFWQIMDYGLKTTMKKILKKAHVVCNKNSGKR